MIDAIDKKILRRLQNDGRMSATALAAEVGLTVAPCHRRLKDLESENSRLKRLVAEQMLVIDGMKEIVRKK